MELTEFLIFLSINIVLLVITLVRKGTIFSVLGTITCLFFLGAILNSPLVLTHYYVVIGTTVNETLVYADPTITVLVLFLVIITHVLAVIKITGD